MAEPTFDPEHVGVAVAEKIELDFPLELDPALSFEGISYKQRLEIQLYWPT